MKKIDLHIHTTSSDGTVNIEKIMEKSRSLGLNVISITDHDTTLSVPRAMELGDKLRIKVIPGIELTVSWKSTVHILGYNIDISNSDLKKACKQQQNNRMVEMIKIFRHLSKFGVNIEQKDILKYQLNNLNVLTKYLLKKGYGKTEEDIFNKFFSRSASFCVSRCGLDSKEAIDLIKNSGGSAILAHPDRIRVDKKERWCYIEKLCDFGLDGIEVYSEYNNDVKEYKDFCIKNNLIITGGSDFHNFSENMLGMYQEKELPYDIIYKSIYSKLL